MLKGWINSFLGHNVREQRSQFSSWGTQNIPLLETNVGCSAVARGGAGGRPPNNYGDMDRKTSNRWVPHIYELVFKIGSICSDFRNENFKNFQGNFPPDPLDFARPSCPHHPPPPLAQLLCPATVLRVNLVFWYQKNPQTILLRL